MISTPTSVRMISGRTRKYSEDVGMKLSSMDNPRVAYQSGSLLLIWPSGLQDQRVLGADRGQERLGKRAHPEHQRQQRNDRRPFARREVIHVMAHRFGCLPIKRSLVQPQHVTRGKNHA